MISPIVWNILALVFGLPLAVALSIATICCIIVFLGFALSRIADLLLFLNKAIEAITEWLKRKLEVGV